MLRLASGKKLPLLQVRRSRVHGNGVFALRRIRKATRVIEYTGEHLTHKEADRRYETRNANDNHTFLFILDGRTVIDAGVGGNEARFINHSCEPNCESVIENHRIYIYATQTMEPGEELPYDYHTQREQALPRWCAGGSRHHPRARGAATTSARG